jgi:hypothetical protein
MHTIWEGEDFGFVDHQATERAVAGKPHHLQSLPTVLGKID